MAEVDDEELDLLRQMRQDTERQLAEMGAETRESALSLERTICQKVKELRESRGWSQADLAQELAKYGFDMHQTTVAKLEKGQRPLRVAEATMLAIIFGLPPAALFLLPMDNAPMGVEHVRDELARLQEHQEATQETMLGTVETLVSSVAWFEARRMVLAEKLRQVAGEADGEPQETP